MASHSEKDAGDNREAFQATDFGGLGEDDISKGLHVEEENAKEEFDCPIVNGILAPVPLSMVPMDSVSSSQQPESSGKNARKRSRSTASSSTSRNEEQKTPPVDGETQSSESNPPESVFKKFFFKLYKFPEVEEQYILEKYEVETMGIERWHLFLEKKNEQWVVGIYELKAGNHNVLLMEEDPIPPRFPIMFNYTLQERLIEWELEKRKRPSGKDDNFYYHKNRQFRSFIEVATYILYASKVKDLRHQH